MIAGGFTCIASNQSVDETVRCIENLLRDRNVKIFDVIDHSGEAAKAGLKMPNTKLVIFGNPAVGTPVMLAAPSAALDLPLKLLVSEDENGETWITYSTARYLQARHQIPEDLIGNLALPEGLAEQVAK
jgi:uncharacterized protein (DUF302 family)